MFLVKDLNKKNKMAGRSIGRVIDNRDPEKRGRIKVQHRILNETTWIPYLRVPGVYSVPQVGDDVYIEADAGFFEYPIAWGNASKTSKQNEKVPEVFQEDFVPRNMGMHSPGGHLFEMHDGVVESTSDPAKNTESKTKRGIRWTSIGEHKIHINDEDDKIEIKTKDGLYIIIDQKNKSIDVNSNGTINITSEEDTKLVSGAKVIVQAVDQVKVEADSVLTETSGNTVMTATGQFDAAGTSKTNVGIASSPTDVNGSVVKLAGGGTPLLLSTAQFIGVGNLGSPVISNLMSGQATKVLGV